ncbi:hypothetical protein C8R44DRAFT_746599 [Mycena epipterygia]|nr:hypothetical protein C8R44DRAFT_746599 [Mycena epipterygia]
MREFHRIAQLEGMLNGILDETSGNDVPVGVQLEHQFIQLLFGSADDREALGTIQDAAAHGIPWSTICSVFNPFSERTSSRVLAGSIAEKSARIEDDSMRLGIMKYYNHDGSKVHLPGSVQRGQNTEMLGSFAEILDYALLDGRRVTSTTRSMRGHGVGSSLIQIQFNGEIYAGEIRHIFRHKQPGIPESQQTLLVFVVWMIPSEDTPLDDDDFIWYDFPELGAETWIYEQYAPPNDPEFPPQVLPLADIQCQVSRGIVRYTEPPLWITTTMDRVRSYGLGNVTGNDE